MEDSVIFSLWNETSIIVDVSVEVRDCIEAQNDRS